MGDTVFQRGGVLWGAFVRATGSGAGCGNKWPGCGRGVLGTSTKTQTIIEFTHRMTSAIALLMVISLVLWCWRVTSKRDWARYSAILGTVFLANEALLGAALVLLGHVARDQSAGRTVFLCLHFGNTLLLLATLALTAAWLQSGSGKLTLIQKPTRLSAVVVGLVVVMSIGMTGNNGRPGRYPFPRNIAPRITIAGLCFQYACSLAFSAAPSQPGSSCRVLRDLGGADELVAANAPVAHLE